MRHRIADTLEALAARIRPKPPLYTIDELSTMQAQANRTRALIIKQQLNIKQQRRTTPPRS